ncbi:topology modulation protein, partial [Staphylococcus epidermidis]|nr:topology modulation protein [Staphylococcus epidermidis]
CILRVIKRYIYSLFNREHIGGNPKTLSFEFIKYIWDFPKNNEQFIMQQMKRSIPNVQWIIDDSKALSLRFL